MLTFGYMPHIKIMFDVRVVVFDVLFVLLVAISDDHVHSMASIGKEAQASLQSFILAASAVAYFIALQRQ